MRELQTPPYRIETQRLAVRCWNPRDVLLYADAVNESIEHLRPWFSWASEEPSLDDKIRRLRFSRSQFDADEDYEYGIFDRTEDKVLGGAALYRRVDDGTFEIGCWIRKSALGQRYAREAAAVLTHVSFGVCGLDYVEARITPDNKASKSVLVGLGFVEERTLPFRLDPLAPGGPRREAILYSMYRHGFHESAANTAWPIAAAYDCAGRSLDPESGNVLVEDPSPPGS
jgi:RimJ/RimL family protein N-acetyltransferase